MTDIKLTEELARVAERCVWYKTPQEAVTYPEHFIAHVLTYGTHEDVNELRRQVGDDALRDALDNAPAGVFDARSWNYWNPRSRSSQRTALAATQVGIDAQPLAT